MEARGNSSWKPVPPFVWQNKCALMRIRQEIEHADSALLVYLALTEVANEKQSAEFRTPHAYLVSLCRLCERTVRSRLEDLKRIGLVKIMTPALKAPCTYTLILSGNDDRALGNDYRTFGNKTTPKESVPLPTYEEIENEESKKATRARCVASKKVDSNPKTTSTVLEVQKGYAAAFQAHVGTPYVAQYGRDGKAVKAILVSHNPEEVIRVATEALALSGYLGNRASTLHGLCESWNEINAELSRTNRSKVNRPTNLLEIT